METRFQLMGRQWTSEHHYGDKRRGKKKHSKKIKCLNLHFESFYTLQTSSSSEMDKKAEETLDGARETKNKETARDGHLVN